VGATAATLFQLGAAFAVLLPPTAFMGATLPLLARHAVRSEAEIGSRVGVLYAVNTAGAIAGTLCAAFWLMPELGLRRTVWVGAVLNGLVFALAALLARRAVAPPTGVERSSEAPVAAGSVYWILPAIAISGAISFVYEVLWTRLLGQVLGASLDAFATMLASFLLGIALGSAVAARVATSRERAAGGFVVVQLGIALTSYLIFAHADRLPELARELGAGPGAPLASAAVAAAALLPITLCIGATFPFAVRLLARSPEHAARATARIYAWNTVGAIFGALGAGFILLPRLGFAGAVGVGVAGNLGLALLAALAGSPRRKRLALAAVAAGGILLAVPPSPPWDLLRSSPLSGRISRGEIAHFAVGRSSSVLLVYQGHFFQLSSNGLPEARIERAGLLPLSPVAPWLGLLPAVVRPDARDLLVVGLGGGSALEFIPSSVRSIDVIELEPEVLAANRRMSGERAVDPLADARVRVHIGDARGVLQLTGKSYDAIVSQPSHPWTAGASHLYTREFFSLVRSRLRPDGVFVQWIGLGFVDEVLLRSLTATLVDAFEYVEVYQPGGSMGVLFAASDAPLDFIEGANRALRAAPDDFARLGFHTAEDIAVIRVLDSAGARELAEGSALTTDDHNLLASHSLRLAEQSLDRDSVRKLWAGRDPLLSNLEGLDRSALIRGLLAMKFKERATELAYSEDEVSEETGFGWIEIGRARNRRAVRHFIRALTLEPESTDARIGLVASRAFASIPGVEIAGISQGDLDARLQALIAARRHAQAGDWDAVALLDGELAGFEPGDALWGEVSRLRVRWRLESGTASAGAEALEIVDVLLVRTWTAHDALLRARAAIAAGRPEAAWGALSRVAEVLQQNPSRVGLLRPALEIAEALPEEESLEIRERLNATRRPAGGMTTRRPPPR